jgi:hypothetical protein
LFEDDQFAAALARFDELTAKTQEPPSNFDTGDRTLVISDDAAVRGRASL